ncbi:hypothetical protein J5N97_005929 [Dioscorea zingiberensis]|uniref:BZIP domain-containing protein n=1 Tax=Dioscorea zingiberensis TaxID=325984 RepID=A0A9D5HST2_9LILI|nr:hypothetical protein J5N97_005929 [Dioscorea zingiberensis]
MAAVKDGRSYGLSAAPAIIFAQLFGIAAITLMLVWLLHFREGVALNSSVEVRLLNDSMLFSSSRETWERQISELYTLGLALQPSLCTPCRSVSGLSSHRSSIMADEDVDTSTENQKSSSVQEQPPASSPVTVYPDWASFQAYYNAAGNTTIPPPGFFHSPVASSPQGHPFMWSPQMIPPYGTAPFVAMYPPGAIYPHPSVPAGTHPYGPYAVAFPNGINEPSVPVTCRADADAKPNESKARSPLKRSKGSLGSLNVLTGKRNAIGKASSASANGAQSQSGESGSEGSSEGSYANSQNGSQHREDEDHGSGDGEAQNGSIIVSTNEVKQAQSAPTVLNHNMPFIALPPGAIAGPTTTLNIGMDYMGGPVSPVPTIRGKPTAAPLSAGMHPSCNAGSRDAIPSDLWLRDERDLKRERRKQSNRESARRSRLRKQAECEELAQRVITLTEENDAFRVELDSWREECEKLALENASLTEQIQQLRAKESRADEPDLVLATGFPDKKKANA